MTTFIDSRNQRGNTKDRRVRRQWLIDTFGDGKEAQCAFDDCSQMLDIHTITVDRFPIPGVEGGRYVRGNIRPACGYHNSQDGAQLAMNRRMSREMGYTS
jgi:hypothetical protein